MTKTKTKTNKQIKKQIQQFLYKNFNIPTNLVESDIDFTNDHLVPNHVVKNYNITKFGQLEPIIKTGTINVFIKIHKSKNIENKTSVFSIIITYNLTYYDGDKDSFTIRKILKI